MLKLGAKLRSMFVPCVQLQLPSAANITITAPRSAGQHHITTQTRSLDWNFNFSRSCVVSALFRHTFEYWKNDQISANRELRREFHKTRYCPNFTKVSSFVSKKKRKYKWGNSSWCVAAQSARGEQYYFVVTHYYLLLWPRHNCSNAECNFCWFYIIMVCQMFKCLLVLLMSAGTNVMHEIKCIK